MHMSKQKFEQGFAWQLGVWDSMAESYQREIDSRFVPIVELLLAQAELRSGEKVIDLGTGTGAVALSAAEHVGDGGSILAVDISSQMLAIAQARGHSRNITNIEFKEGSGEAVPAEDQSQNAVLALGLNYVERFHRRATRGHGVFEQRHRLARLESALNSLAEAVLLALLADEEAQQRSGGVARGGGGQHRGYERHGADRHAAHGVDRRPGVQPVEHQRTGQRETARSHQRLAQIEVEVAFSAARERHLLPAERDVEDQLEQFVAHFSRPHGASHLDAA